MSIWNTITNPALAILVTAILLIGCPPVARAWGLPFESEDGPVIATVTFTRSSWVASPDYYSVSVSSLGTIVYESTPNSDVSTGDPYLLTFQVSGQTRSEILRLVGQLRYFQGRFATRQAAWSYHGTKTLTFAEASTKNQIVFTSSTDPAINKLTALFENLSATLECGRTLDRLSRSNPAGLHTELKRIEQLAGENRLVGFSAIAPEVRRITSDAAIPLASREVARAILDKTYS
jgi:hypothetical protein